MSSATTAIDTSSVLSVLVTAFPVLQTNPAAASSILSSDFHNSQTPSWFSALPSDVQTYLIQQGETTLRTTSTANGQSQGSATTVEVTSLVTLPPLPSQTNTSTSKDNGLSGGAIAGIVIGSLLGTLLLATAAYTIALRLRIKKTKKVKEEKRKSNERQPEAPPSYETVHNGNVQHTDGTVTFKQLRS